MASQTICPWREEWMVLRKRTKVWEQMGPARMAGNHSLCGATQCVTVWACLNLQWDMRKGRGKKDTAECEHFLWLQGEDCFNG